MIAPAWSITASLLAASADHGSPSPVVIEAPGPVAQGVTAALGLVVALGMATLVLGIVLCLWRILRGPHLADRVLAADTLALQVVGLVIVLAIQLRTTAFFAVALVVAIIGFVSTLAFAQYIGARRRV